MPQGDAGGHFASSGGYGGNFGGAGGAAGHVSGSEHGMLGFGGMSPGGYDADVYAANLAGIPGTPGFGARRAAAQRARQLALQQQRARSQSSTSAGTGAVSAPVTQSQILGPLDTPPAPVLGPFSSTNPVPSRPQVPGEEPPVPGSNLTPSGVVTPSTGYWGSGPGPVWGGRAHRGGMGGFGTTGSGWQGGYGNQGADTTENSGFNHRQFGGPVNPGQQYTVGENGPETLQMGPNGGGQVIPNNPMDRMQGGFPGGAGQPGMGGGAGQLGGMNPQTLQALFQMIQQQKQGQSGGGGLPTPGMPQTNPMMPQKPQMSQPVQMPGPMGQSPGGSFRLGDWRNRMGIEGLSRPSPIGGGGVQRPNMGFGGSGLGIPGVMPHLANRGGLGGGTRTG